MLLGIETAGVIHDFWVPELGRKIDAIPGKRNFVWIRAGRTGEYGEACAEYCGSQHAWMRLRVVSQDDASYNAWLAAQAAPAMQPISDEAREGETRLKQLICVNCHNIRGVNQQEQYAADLTPVGSRKMLAAERLTNNTDNLRDWLRQPNIIKPNCLMPNLNLDDSDLNALTAYLGNLK